MSTSKNDFNPDWVSPPGDTIRDLQECKGVSDQALALALQLDEPALQDLLDGRLPIDSALAERLASAVGGTKDFWLRREGNYRSL
jgi:HTH-type transcriptional regulator/antitoxin HigA